MPPVLRNLPPLSPRVPPSKSPSAIVKEKSLTGPPIVDPAPEHLSVPIGEADFADSRDLDDDEAVDESQWQEFVGGMNDENSVSSSRHNHNKQHNYAGSDASSCSSNASTFSWRAGRNSKVSSTDVASVGNASDTGVPWVGGVSTTGRALHESAKLALNAGNYGNALELFEAILQAQQKRFGTSSHASVAAAMHNVGVCRQRMGQHQVAETLLSDAVQIREKTLGKYHVEVAASLSKLGSVRISLGKFEEAFVDLRKALSIAQKSAAGESNSAGSSKMVAQMLCHLACLYFEKGELFAAQATFQDALDIYRKVWSQEQQQPTPPATSSSSTRSPPPATTSSESANNAKSKNALLLQLTDTLCNIGSILNRRKCFAQAVANFQEALDLQRGIFEHNDHHPRIISTLDNLAYSYSKNKEYARAVTCYRTMLRAQVAQAGTFTQECLLTFRKRIVMYEKLRLNVNEAIHDTKDVLRLQKTFLNKDDAIVVETKALLEELQAKKKRDKKKLQGLPPQAPEQPIEC